MKLLAVTMICLAGAIACAPRALAYDHEHIAIHADGASQWGAFSADGRYVTLATYATNLAEGDTNGSRDIVIYDRETHHFSLVSVASDGSQGNGDSQGGAMSQDGRYVVFDSKASNLVPGDTNGVWDTFVRDRLTGQTSRVSISTDGVQGNDQSASGRISADGRYVVFSSHATNLVPGDTNGVDDVFLRDLVTHQTTRVSLASDGSQARGPVAYRQVSADGRHVVLLAEGDPGLVPGVSGGAQLYLRDVDSGETTLIATGTVGYLGCAGISGDGRFVAYYSSGSAYIWDRLTGTSVHIAPILHGQVGDSMSADGRIVGLHTTDSPSILDWMNWTYDTVHEQVRPWGIAGGFMLVSPSGYALAYTSFSSPSSAGDLYLTDTDGTVCSFGSIAGTVTAGGAPVADAEVWIDGFLWTKSDADGRYRFPSVPADDGYSLTVTSWGRQGTAADVSVVADQTTTADIALTPPFTDISEGYWAEDAILACAAAGVVRGYADGTYRPDATVTRDQMAVYVARALAGGDALVPTGPEAPSFSDVGADHWAYKYIEYAASPEANVVQGYPGGNYKPDDLVNRGQMAVYIARAMVSPTGDAAIPDPPAGDPTFSDVTATGDWSWCYQHVEYLAAEGIVQGYPDGTYHPATIVTRDQMAVYVARAFALPL
jgi:Tol biopolymer transport system component